MSKLSKQVLSFVFISILTINVFSIPVFATDKIETQHEEETTIEELGGGPSPSGAWEYSKTIKKTFTQNQLKKLNTKLQAAVKKGEKTQTAYDAALYLVGILGGKAGTAFAGYLTFLTTTQPKLIQKSANTVASALSKNKSVTISIKVYIRPVNGAKLYLYDKVL